MAPLEPAAQGFTPVDHDPFAAGPPLLAFVPVTQAQSEIWLACALDAQVNLAYNEGLALQLRGSLDRAALEAALRAVVARHESLRACFSPDGRWMCIAESMPAPLPFAALDHAADAQAAFRAAAAQAMATPFDLEQGPLARFALYRLGAQEHRLVFVAHHIVCDGWSMAQLMVEIGALYSAAVEQRALELPYAADRYTEYSRLEREYLASADGRAELQWWLGQLRDAPPPVELPADRARPAQRSYDAARYDHRLPAELAAELRRFGAAHNTSLVMTLLAAFGAQLQRLTGAEDLVIGLAAAGQSLYERPRLVGHCVNFLPLRLRPRAQQSFTELLAQTRGVVLDAFEHQHLSFGALLPQLGLERDEARPPLISVVFNIDVRDDHIGHAGLEVQYESLVRQQENFELFLNVVDDGRELLLECSYNRRLFDEATIRRRMFEYERLLCALGTQLQRPLCELPLLSAGERTRLLEDFGGEARPLPERGLHLLIAQRAAAQPDATAVECGGQRLSYRALCTRADGIAAALRSAGVQPGQFVAVCLRRRVELPAALLGVLKAGAAYLPLDPELPAQRLRYMFDDAQACLLLCERATADAPGDAALPRLLLENVGDAAGPVEVEVAPDSPAYAIYTSGSTGAPKGVVAHHRGVVNCLEGTRRRIGIAEHDALLAIATYAFDASVLEIFLPLLYGARLVVARSEEAADGALLAAAIERHGITRIFTAPAAWRLLLGAGWQGKADLTGISWAEPLTADLAAALLPKLRELWNLYGPTETTVWTLGSRIVDRDAPITIGAPIPNTRAYVLDASLAPVPVGVTGELYIGGAGVGIGYLQRPELTRERFLPDPFVPGTRMYRTGDLARWTEQGEIVCLGRADHQVKLRGFRIELGEIEALLKSQAEVADAACGLRERTPGDARLVAWVQPAPGTAPGAQELRRQLRAQLPGYMVPQHFALLDALPRLASGKLDRKRLPSPFEAALAEAASAAAPRSATERRLCELWREVLGHEAFGMDDRFLDVGGHSLLAVQLAGRLREAFGFRPPLREVMSGTLAQLAALCDEHAPTAACPEPAAGGAGELLAAAAAPARSRSRSRSLWERLIH